MNKKIILTIITCSLILASCGKSTPTNSSQQDGKTSSVVVTTNTADAKSPLATPNNSSDNKTGNGKTSSVVVTTNTADAKSSVATPNNSSDNKTGNVKTQVSSENNKKYSVLQAYKAVLQNKVNFFSTDNKKNVYLNDFLSNEEIYGTKFQITHFAVIDMDGDKIPEVVLELSDVHNNPICFEILHYINGEVYGYNIVYRGLEGLKMDGTFIYSGGAADNGYGRLIFQSNVYKTDTLGYSKSSQDNDKLNISYFINNKPVTEESFNSFIKEQQGKKDVVWYEFSQKNIETELAINP